MDLEELKTNFKYYSNFPNEGINFVDVGSIMQDGEEYNKIINLFIEKIESKFQFDKIVALESRGFLFACPVAYSLKKGLSMVRKKGKLPGETISVNSTKEYGVDVLEMQKNSIKKGEKVLIIDDILATGGTARATIELIEKIGGNVSGLAFIGEIDGLPDYDLFKGYDIFTMFKF